MASNRSTDIAEIREGKPYTWGVVVRDWQIGPYDIVEYHPWKSEGVPLKMGDADETETAYGVWVDSKSTSRSTSTLDEALAWAITYRHDGPNSQAGDYFIRGLCNA